MLSGIVSRDDGWMARATHTHTHKKKLWVHRFVLGSIASDQEENRVHKEPINVLGNRKMQMTFRADYK